MRPQLSILFALLAPTILILAQDGGINPGDGGGASAAGYKCDPSKCKLPSCHCASTDPPGGLSPSDTPMFVIFTADDAIQSYTLDSVNQFLAHRKNPNGCQPKMTYFTSLNYTDYSLVTDWFVAGNEIGDHTMTHVADAPRSEIEGNLIALNALAGIPFTSIRGFRAPFLNYTVNTLKILADLQFYYDSSAVASVPVTDNDTDAFWPYTLDYGIANGCTGVIGACQGEPKLPGLWEIPMYAFFDKLGINGPHLMDPWLDIANGGSKVDDAATLAYMKSTFMDHYNGKRQPIGLYTHPIHLSTTYPGVNPSTSTINMINSFLDWAQLQPNTWIISNEQLLAWMQNPTPIAQLGNLGTFKCSTPSIPSGTKICNGIPSNENGLQAKCPFSDAPFSTCYGCPIYAPTVSNPNPEQSVAAGQQARFRLPANCSTPFWDPIAGKCICTSTTCTFTDNSRSISPSNINISSDGLSSSSPKPSYVPFNGRASPSIPSGLWAAVCVGALGAFIGAYNTVGRML